MKIVVDPVKYGPAAKKVKNPIQERMRNPAIRVFAGAPVKQTLVKDEVMSGMGDWWDSFTDVVSQTGDKLWDQAVASGQKAAVKLVEKTIVNIVGADGKPKQVEAGSPEAIAYQNQVAAQQAAAAGTTDPMMKYLMYGGIGLGGLIAVAIVWKMVRGNK